MALHKKRKLWRWSFRILLLIILLPLATLIIVRVIGALKMRRANIEIMSALKVHQIEAVLDTATIGNRQILYVRTHRGEPKQQALVFVHGSPGSLDACLEFLRDTFLLNEMDVVAYDRPGFGESNFGRSWPSLSGQAAALKAVMDDLDYEHYYLAGHSYGAPIIAQTAMRYPHDVAGLSLISGSISPDLEPKSSGWRKWIDLPLLRHLLPITMRVSNEELTPLKSDLQLIDDDWDRIEVPVSVIHGTKDALVPFENLHYAVDKLVNADTVFVRALEGVNHFILWTEQVVIREEVLKLVRREQ